MSSRTFTIAGGLGGNGPVSASVGYLIVKELLKYPNIKVKVLARSTSVRNAFPLASIC